MQSMYFSKKTHLLSYAIMLSALIRLSGAVAESAVRFLIRKRSGLLPDMLDTVLWRVQEAGSVLQIILIVLVFFYTWKKLSRLMGLIDEDDHAELGRLQEEVLGEHLSTLSVRDIIKLIQIWAVVLVGGECVYCFTSLIYRRFTYELMLVSMSGAEYTSFVSIYNMTHGFKYLEMMTALLFGVIVTAVFLDDRFLRIVSLMLAVLFLLAFGVFQMFTLSFSGREIGIVWTSVIFHFTETVGLFVFSVYLSRHYRGL